MREARELPGLSNLPKRGELQARRPQAGGPRPDGPRPDGPRPAGP